MDTERRQCPKGTLHPSLDQISPCILVNQTLELEKSLPITRCTQLQQQVLALMFSEGLWFLQMHMVSNSLPWSSKEAPEMVYCVHWRTNRTSKDILINASLEQHVELTRMICVTKDEIWICLTLVPFSPTAKVAMLPVHSPESHKHGDSQMLDTDLYTSVRCFCEHPWLS